MSDFKRRPIVFNLDRRTVTINADEWNAGEEEVKAGGNLFIAVSRDATVAAPMDLVFGKYVRVAWFLSRQGELSGIGSPELIRYGHLIELPITQRFNDHMMIEGDWPQAEIDAAQANPPEDQP